MTTVAAHCREVGHDATPDAVRKALKRLSGKNLVKRDKHADSEEAACVPVGGIFPLRRATSSCFGGRLRQEFSRQTPMARRRAVGPGGLTAKRPRPSASRRPLVRDGPRRS